MQRREFTADTSVAIPELEPSRENAAFAGPVAGIILWLRLAAASTEGVRQCFLDQSSTTQLIAGAYAQSSTGIREMTPEIRAKFDALFDAAGRDIIEDGMPNAITERLPGLVARDFNAVMPALTSMVEGGRTQPIIAAEVLKELGRDRNAASHAGRLWILERALSQSCPFIRDGAGLGLARLGDPSAIPYLLRAAENEPDAQIRADLQLVIDELQEIPADGAPVASRQ